MEDSNHTTRIIFENEESQRTTTFFQAPNPKIIQWVIKYSGGVVKNEKQANLVLICLSIIAIIISLFLFFAEGAQEIPQVKIKL